MKISLRFLVGTGLILLILACSGEMGHQAAKLFPFLRSVNPELNYAPVDCQDDYDEPESAVGCVMEVIECGDEIEATTRGGSMSFSDEFYQEAWLTPFGHNYGNSPEVVYQLNLPERKHARLTLISPCADLDLIYIDPSDGDQWSSEDECPQRLRQGIEGDISLEITAVDQIDLETAQFSMGYEEDTVPYLIIIDGKSDGDDGQAGNFRLEVECWDK